MHHPNPERTYVYACVRLFAPQRNYRTFLLFIYSTSLYIAWTFGVSLGSLFVKHDELEAAAAAGAQQQQSGGDSLSSNLWLQTLGEGRVKWGWWLRQAG